MPEERPDAASVMQGIIDSHNSGGGDPTPPLAPEPTPAPEPAPIAAAPGAPADPPAAPPGDQPPADPPQEPNWYESLLAEDQDRPDELSALVNEETFNGLRANPEQLADWAQKALGHLRKYGEGAERERTLAARAEYAGGWDNAPRALDIYGDLFRGDLPLEEADRAEFPEAQSYAERAVMRVMSQDQGTAYSLGAAILNHMPDLLTHNADYLLRALGYDPKYAADYKRVAEAGGFQVTEDQQAVQQWFKDNDIPVDQLTTLRSLPIKVQQDLLAGNAEAGKFHLHRYHNDRLNEERTAKAEESRRTQERERVEYDSARNLATETRKVFDEYVEKGKAYGLDPIQSAGVAALAYAELEKQYWEEGSESRKVLDGLHGHIKTGNKLQIDSGRSAYRKAFEAAYRKAASQYKSSRPGVPPAPKDPRQPGAPVTPGQPQFTPATPPAADFKDLRGEDLMLEIQRRHGMAIPAAQ